MHTLNKAQIINKTENHIKNNPLVQVCEQFLISYWHFNNREK